MRTKMRVWSSCNMPCYYCLILTESGMCRQVSVTPPPPKKSFMKIRWVVLELLLADRHGEANRRSLATSRCEVVSPSGNTATLSGSSSYAMPESDQSSHHWRWGVGWGWKRNQNWIKEWNKPNNNTMYNVEVFLFFYAECSKAVSKSGHKRRKHKFINKVCVCPPPPQKTFWFGP
jgi:hypothetical protein